MIRDITRVSEECTCAWNASRPVDRIRLQEQLRGRLLHIEMVEGERCSLAALLGEPPSSSQPVPAL